MSWHSFARLKHESLLQNHFDALASMVCKDGSHAAHVFRKVSSQAYGDGLMSTRKVMRNIISICLDLPDITAPNLMSFVADSGWLGDLYSETRELNSFINQLEELPEFGTLDLSGFDIEMCEDCNSWEYGDETLTTYHEGRVCRVCINHHYDWSSYYDQYVCSDSSREALDRHGREVTIDEDDDNFSWDDDLDTYVHCEYNPRPDVFGGYHDSKRHQHPISNTWSSQNNNIYFGIELEVEYRGETYRKVEDLHHVLNAGQDVGYKCFFESDGSLNNGFEIITQPMGMDDHRTFWQWLNSRDNISGLKSHNTSTCGLHIHISRGPLVELQINKMITFVNHPDNSQLILAIARRYDTGYARIKNKSVDTAQHNADRYEAINICTSGNKTLEFRLFKGTLKYESVLASLQFVNALAKFCNSESFDLTTPLFLEFIQKTSDTDVLVPYIKDRLSKQGVIMPELSQENININLQERN